MPVFEALSSLAEEAGTRKLKKLAGKLAEEVRDGERISVALEKARLFPTRYVSLVRLGEETGKLSEQLRLIITDMRKERQFRSKVQNALLYPGIVCLLTICVGLVSVWFIFPKLIDTISQLGGTVPLPTRIIIAIGTFFKEYGTVAVPPAISCIILLAIVLFVWKKTKIAGEYIVSALPAARMVIEEIEIARFGHALGTLLSAGLDLPRSLAYLEEATPRILYARFYSYLKDQVIEGIPLSEAIGRYPRSRSLMPLHVRQLIAAAEASGSLSETFTTIGDIYQEKTDNISKNVGAILEPVIIIVVGLAVAFVAIGVIGPIYGLVNQIGP